MAFAQANTHDAVIQSYRAFLGQGSLAENLIELLEALGLLDGITLTHYNVIQVRDPYGYDPHIHKRLSQTGFQVGWFLIPDEPGGYYGLRLPPWDYADDQLSPKEEHRLMYTFWIHLTAARHRRQRLASLNLR